MPVLLLLLEPETYTSTSRNIKHIHNINRRSCYLVIWYIPGTPEYQVLYCTDSAFIGVIGIGAALACLRSLSATRAYTHHFKRNLLAAKAV